MSRIKHITIKPKDEADAAIIQQFNEYQSEWLLKALEAREEIRPEMTRFKQALKRGDTPSPSLFLSDEDSARIAGTLTDRSLRIIALLSPQKRLKRWVMT